MVFISVADSDSEYSEYGDSACWFHHKMPYKRDDKGKEGTKEYPSWWGGAEICLRSSFLSRGFGLTPTSPNPDCVSFDQTAGERPRISITPEWIGNVARLLRGQADELALDFNLFGKRYL